MYCTNSAKLHTFLLIGNTCQNFHWRFESGQQSGLGVSDHKYGAQSDNPKTIVSHFEGDFVSGLAKGYGLGKMQLVTPAGGVENTNIFGKFDAFEGLPWIANGVGVVGRGDGSHSDGDWKFGKLVCGLEFDTAGKIVGIARDCAWSHVKVAN